MNMAPRCGRGHSWAKVQIVSSASSHRGRAAGRDEHRGCAELTGLGPTLTPPLRDTSAAECGARSGKLSIWLSTSVNRKTKLGKARGSIVSSISCASRRFGLYSIDVVGDPTLTRVPTDAVATYRSVITSTKW